MFVLFVFHCKALPDDDSFDERPVIDKIQPLEQLQTGTNTDSD